VILKADINSNIMTVMIPKNIIEWKKEREVREENEEKCILWKKEYNNMTINVLYSVLMLMKNDSNEKKTMKSNY